MLLTFDEARKRLGVSRPTMYRIVDLYKELPVAHEYYHGQQRRRYFNSEDIDALIKKRNPSTIDLNMRLDLQKVSYELS